MARRLALVALGSLVGLVGAGCGKSRDAAPANEVAVTGAPPLASAPFFRVDATPLSPCAAGSTCEAKLVLTALGDYHVNAEYPTKFVADAASDVTVDGQGSFKIDSEKRGTLTVRFTAAKPGPTKLTGTFKLSVCSEENCEIEAPKISLDVTSS